MKYLYLSRLFNRSGYSILKYLLEKTGFRPQAVCLPLPKADQIPEELNAIEIEKKNYLEEIQYYGAQPLRFFNSCRLLSEQYHIPCIELQTIKDNRAYDRFKSNPFDLMVIGGGWPEIIPAGIIRLPKLGIINAHPSLLPKFRGTDVHRWQIFHGVRESGVTVHFVDEGIDTGDILAQGKVAISNLDTPQQLAEKTAAIAGPLLAEVFSRMIGSKDGEIKGIPQAAGSCENQCYGRWKWNDHQFLKLDFNKPAQELHRLILACTQESFKYNGPWFSVQDKRYIVRKASFLNETHETAPGTIVHRNCTSLRIACPNSFLTVESLQPTTLSEMESGFNQKPAVPISEICQSQVISSNFS